MAKVKRAAARIYNVSLDFKKVAKEISSPKYMKEVGQFAADMIKKRSRLGSSVSDRGNQKEKFKQLSDPYVEQRKKDKTNGKLSEFTSAKKSNLTRTGQLLDSIAVKEATPRTATIGPSGQRNDGKSNQKVGEFVSDAGRPFNNLSNVEIKRVSDKIRRDVMSLLKKRLMK